MSGFSIDISGNINQKLTEMENNVKRVIQQELDAFGIETVADAQRNITLNKAVDTGNLRMKVGMERQDLAVKFVVPVNYAAFVEFGTGQFAAAHVSMLPPEIQAYAMTFFVSGRGRMPARPFLFPAIEKNLIELKRHLATI